jgi:tRNA-dihydrouridine synthase
MYGGAADLDIIKKVKQSLHIPVIGNGDVTDAASAKRMLEYTGCDALMIGRAAVGNPFIFSELRAVLRGEECPPVTLDMRRDAAIKHLRLATLDKGERIAVPEARRQVAAYFKGFSHSARLRGRINTATTEDEIIRAIMEVTEIECDI